MPSDGILDRLVEAVTPMRSVSKRNLQMWLESHENHFGGLLVIQASWRGRDLVEAAFRTETWPV